MGKLAAFWRLSRGDKWLFLEATWSLFRARNALKRHPFSRLRESLAAERDEAPLPPESADTARRIGHAVSVMARHVPWSAECLARAFAARTMLRRRGLPSTVYVGVAKDPDETLASHAWLRCGDDVVTGAKGRHRFRVITTFGE